MLEAQFFHSSELSLSCVESFPGECRPICARAYRSSSTFSDAESERRAVGASHGAGGIVVARQSAVHVYRSSSEAPVADSERRAVGAFPGAGGIVVAQQSVMIHSRCFCSMLHCALS